MQEISEEDVFKRWPAIRSSIREKGVIVCAEEDIKYVFIETVDFKDDLGSHTRYTQRFAYEKDQLVRLTHTSPLFYHPSKPVFFEERNTMDTKTKKELWCTCEEYATHTLSSAHRVSGPAFHADEYTYDYGLTGIGTTPSEIIQYYALNDIRLDPNTHAELCSDPGVQDGKRLPEHVITFLNLMK